MRESNASEQFPEELLEYGSDVFFRAGLDLRLQYLSPNVERVLGWARDEMLGRSIDDFIESDDRGDAPEEWFAEQGVYFLRGRVRRKDGSSIWFENRILGVFDDEGMLVAYTGVFRDIDRQVTSEAQLRESEERYRMLAEHASDVVVQTDRDLMVQWVSPSITDVLGWAVADVVGRRVALLIHEDDREVLDASNAAILDGEPVHFEARYRTADGGWRWMSVAARPVFGDDGVVMGRIASWRDIDAEHTQREALRESEERYRLLAEHASDVVVQLDNDGVVRWLSPSTEEILLTPIPDLLGRSVLEIVHPDDLPVILAAQAGALRGEDARLEARYLRGDGSYIWMSVVGSSLLDGEGRAIGRVASARNIDAERTAVDALAASEEQFRFLLENVQDVVVRTRDRRPVFVTSSVERMLGWTPEELAAADGESLIHPDDVLRLPELTELVNEGPVTNTRLRMRHKDGSYRWIEVTARAVGEEDVRSANVAVLRDVSQRVAGEEALAAATAEAQAANLAKTTFLSSMSHELRTPLNAVIGFAQLLAMDPLTDDQQGAIEQILTGGRHLLELINEVLDIARIESGRMTLSPEVVSAADVISECLDLVRPLALQHDVIVDRFDADACVDQLFVDRQRTIQILINLVTNAIKYNRVGGRVRVKCEHDAERPRVVIISVSDDGIGIADADLPKLFAPFERLGAASTGVEGTGIGLALSRGLAEMMGGTITVSSVAGIGSTFRLEVPRGDEPVDMAPLTVPVAIDPASAARRVVYLEDNPANALLMRSIVGRRGGVDLTVVSRGAEALDLLFASPPDLLLLDLHLPDISGDEVLRRLRTDPRTSTVPVVVLTADAAPQVRHRLSTLGADAFLAKPVDIAQVISWIDDPLQGRTSR